MKLKCLVVDDEYPARVLLGNYISKLPQLELVKSVRNPVEALGCMQEQPVDLLFLDIQMPELSGVAFLRSLKQRPLVIFTTAYSDYALEGYQLDVVDYLLKPFSFERFVQAVNKALEWHALRKNNQATRGETDASPAASRLYITVKADHKMVRLLLDDILFIEGLREYVTFHTTSGKLITLEALKNLETLLPSGRFLRVHKSYIVHKEKVKSLYGNQLEIAGQLIPIGKSYKEDVLQHLFR